MTMLYRSPRWFSWLAFLSFLLSAPAWRKLRLASALPAILALLLTPAAGAQIERRLLSAGSFAAGEAGNHETRLTTITPDGRYVLMITWATNLVGLIDDNGGGDVLVLDRSTGAYDLITQPSGNPEWTASGSSEAAAISHDGRYVAFDSSAHDLVADTKFSNPWQTYLFDRVTREATLVSHVAGFPTQGGDSYSGARLMTPDGRFLVFISTASNLVGGGGPPFPTTHNVYLFDRDSGDNLLVSHAAGSAAFANGQVEPRKISDDGRFLLVNSQATDLVAGVSDSDGSWDAFLYDRSNDVYELISRQAGLPALAAGGYGHDLSGDGRYLLLTSAATLLAGITDNNGSEGECYLYDRSLGSFSLISRSAGSATVTGNGGSHCGNFSADGRYVYFTSTARDLIAGQIDDNGGLDDFVFDRDTGTTRLVSHAAGDPLRTGDNASASSGFTGYRQLAAGYHLYGSSAGNLAAGGFDANSGGDTYLYDVASNSSTLISRIGAGAAAGGICHVIGAVAADGQAFLQCSTVLDPLSPDANGGTDVYRHDPANATVQLVSKTLFGDILPIGFRRSGVSEDGRWVFRDGWLHDVRRPAAELVGHLAGSPGVAAEGASLVAIDAAGRYVLLDSPHPATAAGITENNTGDDVYLYDRQSDTATLISHRIGSPAATANRPSKAAWLSADGQRLIFASKAGNLLPAGAIGADNLYFYDRASGGTVTRLSHQAGNPEVQGDADSVFLGISPDERWVLFSSDAQNLVAFFVDGNGTLVDDLFLYDRVLHTTRLITHVAGNPAHSSDDQARKARATGDWRYIYFESRSADLSSEPTLIGTKIYRFDRLSGTVTRVMDNVSAGCGEWYDFHLGDLTPDGRLLLVSSDCGLVPGDLNQSADAYLYDQQTATFELISHQPGNPAAALGYVTASDLSDDGRRIVYLATASTPMPVSAPGTPWSYDRRTQVATPLLPSYFHPLYLLSGAEPQASRDGSAVLVSTPWQLGAPYDANQLDELFLITAGPFADGFESGATGAWSLTVP